MTGLGQSLMDQPPTTMTTDPNTGYQQSMQARNAAESDRLTREYTAARANPNFALGTPQEQAFKEQQIVDSSMNDLGNRNIGGGAAKAQTGTNVVNWRLGQLAQQQTALNNYRTQINQANQGLVGSPYDVTPISASTSPTNQITNSMISKAGGMMVGPGT
jgi:hypothetical protein